MQVGVRGMLFAQFNCMFFYSHFTLQAAKTTSASEQLKRCSLFLSELGLKPKTLAARWRASAKSSAHKKEQVPAVVGVGAGDEISRI